MIFARYGTYEKTNGWWIEIVNGEMGVVTHTERFKNKRNCMEKIKEMRNHNLIACAGRERNKKAGE